jgi:RNA polymerase sigma-70 factor (ECF subfamily)
MMGRGSLLGDEAATAPADERSRADARAGAAAAEDARLIAGVLGNDRRMFAELYRRHVDSVYARLTRVVGPVLERDDLVQHIFLDVHRALPRFRGEARFSTFLHRIVLNVACEHLERRRRHRGRTLALEPQQLDEVIAPDASPEARVRARQELAEVFRRLEALSPKRRVAFILVAVEGLPLDEAAAQAGCSPDAMKQRVLDARRELARERADLEAKEGGHDEAR